MDDKQKNKLSNNHFTVIDGEKAQHEVELFYQYLRGEITVEQFTEMNKPRAKLKAI